ncbi:zinc finger protein MSN4-like [Bradysia coprophila]|uniref:zinc finger protein MSN4-like n=1 Tax=Bradysia coprophila TaxID=38358 RepID=UPI00187DA6A6|nr:zinc finger protein MSN4-like [Bradysia coprophila]
MDHFQVGTEFHTYRELLAAKYRYEQDTKTLLTTKKSAKYTPDDPRCEDLVYSRIQYQCKAGEERKSTSKGNRAVSSGKMNCPVQVTMSVKEGKLCVLSSMLVHVNHTQDFETFMKYPENLRLKPHEIRYAKELLAKGFNKKTIKGKLKECRGGMPVSPKFWAQIHRASKKDATASDGIQKHEDTQGEDFFDQTFDNTSSFGFGESQSMTPEVKVKQEFDGGHNTSDDDTNDGDNDSVDPLSNMFSKCTADDSTDSRTNAKLKKDFDNWFKNLIPGEKLSYNEWLWQLEFNFPSLDKLNFIKYGIILGMTILNKYYFDGTMKIDGNGIKEVGAEFGRKRKKILRPAPVIKHNHDDDEDDEDDDDDDENDNFHDEPNDSFQHEENLVAIEVHPQIDENIPVATNSTNATNQPKKEISSTGTPSVTNFTKAESTEPTQTNTQPNEPINCKMCTEVFPTHSQLYHHMRKYHTAHIGLNCPICNKRFQYERNMNQHIASVHVNDGSVSNCGDVEAGRSICEICGASFDKISSLKSHSRYVHSIEKFYCQYCNRKLSSKKSLKEHIQFQHELTFVTHECEDCQRIFKYKSSYRLHMKKQHGIHFG